MGYGSLDPRVLRRMRLAERRMNKKDTWDEERPMPSRPSVSDKPQKEAYSKGRLEDCLQALDDLGDLRGLYVSVSPKGTLRVTLKMFLPASGRVYRYGECEVLEDVPRLLLHWCAAGYWTPDKQK